MSVTRACTPCRTAKARCDLQRPACSRCVQRGLQCQGLGADTGLIFRDERQTAQRNSERARREHARPTVAVFDIAPTSVEGPTIRQTSAHELSEADLGRLYPWLEDRALAEVPGPLKRDLCTRAVDAFFVNWTVYPSNDGALPGFFHTLPALYALCEPESALNYAVRAVATADKRLYHDGTISFDIKARRNYGDALARLRLKAGDEQLMTEDCSLATLMLLDNFEEMYLSRSEPLGPHKEALSYILRLRGDGQFLQQSRFDLWRVAHDRLLARQVLFREGPTPEQTAWFEKLDVSAPDLRISADKLRMNTLAAEARRLSERPDDYEDVSLRLDQTEDLVSEIERFLDTGSDWAKDLPDMWTPLDAEPDQAVRSSGAYSGSITPIPRLTCPKMLIHKDITMAYLWNTHACAQIVLRESLIEILELKARLSRQELGDEDEDAERIRVECIAIDRLSGRIIETFPQLMGFTTLPIKYSGPLKGLMVGRFFILASMWGIQKAKHTSIEHKVTATQIVEWINSTHRLRRMQTAGAGG